MGQPVRLREDYSSAELQALARSSKDGDWTRRLLALSLVYDGHSRSEAAAVGGVGLQTLRDWCIRFNAKGPEGLKTGKAPGQRPLLNDHHRQALRQTIERGPTPYLDGVVRWRLCDLAKWLWDELRVAVSEQTLSREIRALGYRKLSARPKHYAQDGEAIEEFKKTFPRQWMKSPRGRAKAR